MAGEIFSQIELLPLPLRLWLNWMQFTLILAPLIFFKTREAQIILAMQLLNFSVGITIFLLQDGWITKLFGLGHVFWFVAYLWLGLRWFRNQISRNGQPFFRTWFYAAMLTLTISLPLDAYDLVLYFNGMTMPLVEYYAKTY